MNWFLLGAVLATTGMGEPRGPSYLMGAELERVPLCTHAQAQTANKADTQAGWLAQGWGEWCGAWGGTGLAYTRRDGGPWVKHTVFLHERVRLPGPLDLTYHQELWQDSPANRVRMLELRTAVGLIDSSLALYHHTQGWGTRWQIGLRLPLATSRSLPRRLRREIKGLAAPARGLLAPVLERV